MPATPHAPSALHDALPASVPTTAPLAPAASPTLGRTLREVARKHPVWWAVALVILALTLGWGAVAQAQEGLTDLVPLASGDPWTLAILALAGTLSQLAVALREWAMARRLQNEALEKRLAELDTRLDHEREARIKAEARMEGLAGRSGEALRGG